VFTIQKLVNKVRTTGVFIRQETTASSSSNNRRKIGW